MKKSMVVILVLVCSVFANAGLVFTIDGDTFGVSCDEPGFILCTARIETEFDLDWSGFATTPTYDYVPGVGLPWGGPPVVLDEAQGLFTAYTSNVTAPTGAIDIFTGVALPPDWSGLSPYEFPGSTPINLIADILNVNGDITSGLLDTIYVLVPEPMTLSLLAGGFAVLKRRSRA